MEFWRGEQEGVFLEGSRGDSSGGVEEEAESEMGEKDEKKREECIGRKGYRGRKCGRGNI